MAAEIAAARLAIAPPLTWWPVALGLPSLVSARGKRAAASARSSPAAVTATVHDGFAQRDLPPLRASLDDAMKRVRLRGCGERGMRGRRATLTTVG